MKVIQSIDLAYAEQKAISDVLKTRVDASITRIKQDNWHYFSRVKQVESFALKLETGRFPDVNNLEDFFACTLVVDNLEQIKKANALIRKHFHVVHQRPQDLAFTHKEPSSFQFDDLRLYAKVLQPDNLPFEPITKLIFEIQIKTFIQHAWSIATHDLIYKANEINWSKERIAFQVKAVLEQAEVTISGVNNLITLPEVAKDNHETKLNKKILSFYRAFFPPEDLPADLVRLCRNTSDLLHNINLGIPELRRILETETANKRGTNLKNLSPYLVILQSIIYQRGDVIERYANSREAKRFKVLLPKELNIDSLKITSKLNVVLLN